MFLNMFKKSLVLVGLSVFALPSTAALYDRGNGLIYDDVLDITWMQDANFVKTSGYAAANINPDNSDQSFFADGSIGWVAAKTWAAQLNYQGFSDWRLASATPGFENPFNVPVNLLFFNAVAKAKNVQLTWATAQEVSNDYFSILHSTFYLMIEVQQKLFFSV